MRIDDAASLNGVSSDLLSRFGERQAGDRGLTQLDAAPTINFMKMPPGNDLKFYEGEWRIRINRQWRLCFKWNDDTGPYDVEICDPH